MIYKVVKNFQGGQSTYHAKLPKGTQIKPGCWDYQLQEWGEETNGGHGYGYRINATPVKAAPKDARWLEFNKGYIEEKTRKK